MNSFMIRIVFGFIITLFLLVFVIRLSKLYSGKFKNYVNFMSQSQWFSEQELEDYQNNKILQLIKHAYETVPYYRRIFDERKLKPGDIKRHQD